MALLPTVKGIRREDLGNDLPQWVDNLLSPLTIFMESLYTALNRNLTFTENIACKIKDIDFTTNSNYTSPNFTTISFPSGLRTIANGLQIIKIDNITSPYGLYTSGITPTWYETNGQIYITYISGLANSNRYKIRFLVI